MCGRATLTCPVEEIAELFEAEPVPLGPPRYNVAPGQPIPVVRAEPAADGARRRLALARWGLVPSWARDPRIGSRCVQARAESAATTPAFRDAFRARRCLVVVDGFYEWGSAGAGSRRPHHVRLERGGPMALAGLWDRWIAPDGEVVESCAVITTGSRGPVRALHDRMPLLVAREDFDRWLRGSTDEAARLLADAETQAQRASGLVVTPVSTYVNDVRHDDPRCLTADEPAPPPLPKQTAFTFR